MYIPLQRSRGSGNMINMECKRCGENVPKSRGITAKYCSYNCAKLYWKATYRRKHKEQINEYNRKRRAMGYRSYVSSGAASILSSNGVICSRCGTMKRIEIHHIKPLMKGGKNEIGNIMFLCHKCHSEFEQLTKSFW